MATQVVSREAESKEIAELLATARSGPSALVVDGEAGIGKTTVWLAALAQAQDLGFRVLSTRATSAESVLAYSSLAGLLDGLDDDAFVDLPPPQRLPMPFELARTQLLVGQLQRRQKQREVASATLREALSVFEDLGTPLWAERARAELNRASGVRTHAELTASEQRGAELAAPGVTNREMAARLFIDPKTVEANLSRVYRKLNIRSRAELGRIMGRAEA